MTIVALSDLLAGARPDTHPIAFLNGAPITLARWRADIAHNAGRLRAKRIHRTALACEEAYWFVTGLLASIHIGSSVILPPNLQPGTLRELRDEFDVLLTDTHTADAALPSLVLESSESESDPLTLQLQRSRIGFFTSGSTGTMKQEHKSLENFAIEARALETLWGAQLEGARVFGTVTHQHVFGMTFRLMWPLLAGRPFQSDFQIAWEQLLSSLTPNAVIVSSPAQLTRLGGLTRLPPALKPLMVITAGAPLPQSAAAEAYAIFSCPPTEIFGSTEAGVIGWRDSAANPGLWRPFPGVEVKVGTDGVLLLRSAHASHHGWAEQADRITLAGDGQFWLEGRIDRIVKIEGKRVSLDRVERSVAALRWIGAAAVIMLGENPLYLGVVAELSPLGKSDIAELGKFRFERMLRRELAQNEDAAVLPRRWRFVEAMPTDGLGKRRNSDLKDLFGKSA